MIDPTQVEEWLEDLNGRIQAEEEIIGLCGYVPETAQYHTGMRDAFMTVRALLTLEYMEAEYDLQFGLEGSLLFQLEEMAKAVNRAAVSQAPGDWGRAQEMFYHLAQGFAKGMISTQQMITGEEELY